MFLLILWVRRGEVTLHYRFGGLVIFFCNGRGVVGGGIEEPVQHCLKPCALLHKLEECSFLEMIPFNEKKNNNQS
jgi:hypothetical protein